MERTSLLERLRSGKILPLLESRDKISPEITNNNTDSPRTEEIQKPIENAKSGSFYEKLRRRTKSKSKEPLIRR